jgi:hypothetical protein
VTSCQRISERDGHVEEATDNAPKGAVTNVITMQNHLFILRPLVVMAIKDRDLCLWKPPG